jgi:hypothetical protein
MNITDMENPIDIISRTGTGRKSPSWHLAGMRMGKVSSHGDGDGEALPRQGISH